MKPSIICFPAFVLVTASLFLTACMRKEHELWNTSTYKFTNGMKLPVTIDLYPSMAD